VILVDIVVKTMQHLHVLTANKVNSPREEVLPAIFVIWGNMDPFLVIVHLVFLANTKTTKAELPANRAMVVRLQTIK